MKHHAAIGGSRRGSGGIDFGRVFLIVVAIHAVAGGAVLFLAKTTAGQQLAKTYDIKLFAPEPPEPEPEPPQTAEEPPPPPPPVEVAPEVEAPKVASAPSAAAAPAASIGGGAPGNSWSGRFAGDSFDGPDGAFHAGVTRVFRDAYREPDTEFGVAEVELTVSGTGAVRSYRLARSSGEPRNDEALLAAARSLQTRGVPAPPENRARAVTVRLDPR